MMTSRVRCGSPNLMQSRPYFDSKATRSETSPHVHETLSTVPLDPNIPPPVQLGESAGSPHFTYLAYDDFRIIRDNLLGGNHVTTGRQVPFCLFTDPEFARIGLSETEAKSRGLSYRLFKIPMAADLRTRTLGETRGFLKAVVDAQSERIFGFTGFGVDAGEIMGTVQMAMIAGLPYTALRDAILTHPTLVEWLIALSSSAPETVHAGRNCPRETYDTRQRQRTDQRAQ